MALDGLLLVQVPDTLKPNVPRGKDWKNREDGLHSQASDKIRTATETRLIGEIKALKRQTNARRAADFRESQLPRAVLRRNKLRLLVKDGRAKS